MFIDYDCDNGGNQHVDCGLSWEGEGERVQVKFGSIWIGRLQKLQHDTGRQKTAAQGRERDWEQEMEGVRTRNHETLSVIILDKKNEKE